MKSNQRPMPAQHLDYLDSARGIAAVMVMCGHFVRWQYADHMGIKIAGIFFNGDAAVAFFFVLSGFVLSYKYIVLNHPLDIRKYSVNRVFRLWPAFFFTIVLNTFFGLNKAPVTGQVLADTFLFDKTTFWEEAMIFWSQQNFYGPGWTLVIELGASMFLPFFIALVKKDTRYLYWILFIMVLFGRQVGFGFIAFFVAGMGISVLFPYITSPSFRQTKWYRYRYLVLTAACILFSLRAIDDISAIAPSAIYLLNYAGISFYTFSCIASFLFIAAMVCSATLQHILRNKVFLFLGRISYGIYLMHWMLVSYAYFYKDDIMKNFSSVKQAYLIVFPVYILSSLLLAVIVHYTIELPFMGLGKRITNRMKPSLTIE